MPLGPIAGYTLSKTKLYTKNIKKITTFRGSGYKVSSQV